MIAAVIGAIVTIAAVSGFSVDAEIVAAVTTLVTAIVVYLVPNAIPVDYYDQELGAAELTD
jgi:uncharacterized paraquat-inducible protein A